MRLSHGSRLGSAAQAVLPFLVAVLVGAGVTLGIRAALQDPGSAHAGHDEHADHAHHGGGATSPSGDAGAGEQQTGTGLLVDLGNAKCPIMGNDVNGEVYSEWRGLRVGHCCPPCAKDFVEDPEKHLDELGVDWRPLVEKIAAAEAAHGAERERLLAELAAEHRIIRAPEGR